MSKSASPGMPILVLLQYLYFPSTLMTSVDKSTIHPLEGQRAYQWYTHCDFGMPSASIVSLSFVREQWQTQAEDGVTFNTFNYALFIHLPVVCDVGKVIFVQTSSRLWSHHAFHAWVNWPVASCVLFKCE